MQGPSNARLAGVWAAYARRFWQEDDGPTATEYAVMLALVIGFIAATLTLYGQSLNAEFTRVDSTLFP